MPGRRWRLHRAGIVNVYQYDNEVIRFAGGRLLLRGVNGSGKTTAMNMLLPFLITAHQRRIDAAGEQSKILRAWMLDGRDDAQPVGYLWIEFERQIEFEQQIEYLACGCGIKANRQSDRVTTWWFITTKRPEVDIRLVEKGVPLSAARLRVELGEDAVFNERRRHDYRQEIERRLFAGADIGQHIQLINRVRNPRVGDRIDVDLPKHLADALPQLSERAVEEAAQPLDDLEEHRRNVEDLARTMESVRGLLDVYSSYCTHDLRQRTGTGNSHLAELRSCAQDEIKKRKAAETAEAEVHRLNTTISDLDDSENRLRGEIAALEESQAYRDGQDLEALRDLVADLAKQGDQADRRVADCDRRVDSSAEQLNRARRRSRRDLQDLNNTLADIAESAGRSSLACELLGPVPMQESELLGPVPMQESEPPATGGRSAVGREGTTAALSQPPTPRPARRSAVQWEGTTAGVPAPRLTEPVEPFDETAVKRGIAVVETASLQRGTDIDEIEKKRDDYDTAEEHLRQNRSMLQIAEARSQKTSERLEGCKRDLGEAQSEWEDRIRDWASGAHPAMHETGVHAPTTAMLTGMHEAGAHAPTTMISATPEDGVQNIEDHEATLSLLRAEIDELVGSRRDTVTTAKLRLETEQAVLDDAQALVDELAARSEPDPPRLEWQSASGYCFADLVDFAPHLDNTQRAGLEAALQASGLLSARVTDDGSAELTNGELVAVAAGGVKNPLSGCLTVTVPERLSEAVDTDLLRKLLESISCNMSNTDTSIVDTSHASTPNTDAPQRRHTSSTGAAVVAAVATDGSFRIGSLRGRHSKENTEFIGVTARREALERERKQAAESLEQARAVVARSRSELDGLEAALEEAENHRTVLPSTEKIVTESAKVHAAAAADDEAQTEREESTQREAESERASRHAWDGLQRAATELRLPSEKHALHEARKELQDIRALLERCFSHLQTLRRSVNSWIDAVAHWRETVDDLINARESHSDVRSKWQRQQARLVTIEDSIGVEYAEILAARDHCKTELAEADKRMSAARSERDNAIGLRASSAAEADVAAERRSDAEQKCDEVRRSLAAALETPGYLAAAVRDTAHPNSNQPHHEQQVPMACVRCWELSNVSSMPRRQPLDQSFQTLPRPVQPQSHRRPHRWAPPPTASVNRLCSVVTR